MKNKHSFLTLKWIFFVSLSLIFGTHLVYPVFAGIGKIPDGPFKTVGIQVNTSPEDDAFKSLPDMIYKEAVSRLAKEGLTVKELDCDLFYLNFQIEFKSVDTTKNVYRFKPVLELYIHKCKTLQANITDGFRPFWETASTEIEGNSKTVFTSCMTLLDDFIKDFKQSQKAAHYKESHGFDKRLPIVNALKERHVVGENNQGYLSFVGGKKEKEHVILQENQERKTYYTLIAKYWNHSLPSVERHQARKNYKTTMLGYIVQNPKGIWEKKTEQFKGDQPPSSARVRQPIIIRLKNGGIIGENNEGYLEFITDKKEMENIVNQENNFRKTIYKTIAHQQGTSLENIERRRGIRNCAKAKSIHYIKDKNGTWIKNGAQ